MPKGSYVRVHDGDQLLSSYEVQLLLSNRSQPKDDAEVVLDASMDDLDEGLVASYVARVRELRPNTLQDVADDRVLVRHTLAKVVDGVLHPTLAGLLAMGRHPQQFFPQLMVTLVVYPTEAGPDLASGDRFLDNVSLEGPVPAMAQGALAAIKRNMRRRSVVDGIGRTDRWDYPEAALREAIVNALVHRDLSPGSRGSQVQIEMYPDRLSIRNPGGLYGPVSVAELTESSTSEVAGTSSARNSFLLRALEDVKIADTDRTVCENRGSGIRTMVESLRAAGMSPPRFKDAISHFSVIVPKHALLDDDTVAWIASLEAKGLTDSQCVGLGLLRSDGILDNARYRAATGVDSRVATSELQDLVGRGLVVQIGARRWTEYRLPTAASPNAEQDSGPNVEQSPLPDTREKVMEVVDPASAIVSVLEDGSLSRAEISSRTGLSQQMTGKWLRRLRSESLVRIHGDEAPTSPNIRYELTPRARGQETLDLDFD